MKFRSKLLHEIDSRPTKWAYEASCRAMTAGEVEAEAASMHWAKLKKTDMQNRNVKKVSFGSK
jgi:hypothetical protein